MLIPRIHLNEFSLFHSILSSLTPLHYAAMNGYYTVAKILIDHGADVISKDNVRVFLFVFFYAQWEDPNS